ncbi:MAG: DUF3592 domain-containing protein [Polyangiaceae bacterium]
MSIPLSGLAILVASAAALTLARHQWRRSRKEQSYAMTQGVVASVDADSSGPYGTVEYAPEGLGAFGSERHLLTGISVGQAKVGEAITVHYDPDHPSRAHLNAAGPAVTRSFLFGILGVLLLALGIISILLPEVISPGQ